MNQDRRKASATQNYAYYGHNLGANRYATLVLVVQELKVSILQQNKKNVNLPKC